jgi:hypothetical protein
MSKINESRGVVSTSATNSTASTAEQRTEEGPESTEGLDFLERMAAGERTDGFEPVGGARVEGGEALDPLERVEGGESLAGSEPLHASERGSERVDLETALLIAERISASEA